MKEKSDKIAKEVFAAELCRRGYSEIKIVKEPADIIAFKDGVKYFFEIKKTSAKGEYFGAATLTEWRAAYSNPNNYFFVICHEVDGKFNFIEYSPIEFEKFSTVPPFKIFFNISLDGSTKALPKRVNRSAVKFNEEILNQLDILFKTLKK